MSDRKGEIDLLDCDEDLLDGEHDGLTDDEREYEEALEIRKPRRRVAKAITVFDRTEFGTKMRERGDTVPAAPAPVKKQRYGWN